MSESEDNSIRVQVAGNPNKIVFGSAHELISWQNDFRGKWNWLGSTPARRVWAAIESHLNELRAAGDEWMRGSGRPNPRIVERVSSAVQQLYSASNFLIGDSSAAVFFNTVLKERGSSTAAGVLVALSHSEVHFDNTIPQAFFDGLIRGFVFENEVKWTSTAHAKVLEELQERYKKHIADQEARLKQLEDANQRLNEAHDSTLKSKSDALEALSVTNKSLFEQLHEAKGNLLDQLHAGKEKAFADLSADYEKKYQAIKKLFTDELALRAPVQYWKDQHTGHTKLAWRFAGLSIAVLGGMLASLINLVHWAFGGLGTNENPKHWQVGVVVIATFFAVWIVRIIVRLFLSHQHLATDASQRVTMVQTYLALSQEEGGVAKEDRSVLLQQLFKSAADGIIKEDGTPPGLAEYISRLK